MKRTVRPDLLEYLASSGKYVLEDGNGCEASGLEEWEEFVPVAYVETPDSANDRGFDFGAYFHLDGMSCLIGEEILVVPNTEDTSPQYEWKLEEALPLCWRFLEEWLVPLKEPGNGEA